MKSASRVFLKYMSKQRWHTIDWIASTCIIEKMKILTVIALLPDADIELILLLSDMLSEQQSLLNWLLYNFNSTSVFHWWFHSAVRGCDGFMNNAMKSGHANLEIINIHTLQALCILASLLSGTLCLSEIS